MKADLIELLCKRVAENAAGTTALRNQGAPGVIKAAKNYLKALDLSDFSASSEKIFYMALDKHTDAMTKRFPLNARNWGAARKCLNLFLRDVAYNYYLAQHYGFRRLEEWLEVPMDSYVANGIRHDIRKILCSDPSECLPKWPGIKHLKPEENHAYQVSASLIAKSLGYARVHLDIRYWRNLGL